MYFALALVPAFLYGTMGIILLKVGGDARAHTLGVAGGAFVTVGGVAPTLVQPPEPFETKYSTVSVGFVPVRLVVWELPSYVHLPPVRSTVNPPLTTFRSAGRTVSE